MTVFLDACAIIYWIEASPPFHGYLLTRLRQYRNQGARLAASRLSYLECLVKPLRDNDEALTADYRAWFAAPDLQLVELDQTVIEGATRLRATLGLKTPDALQVASALALPDRVVFLTGDRRLDRVPGLTVQVLQE